MNAAHKTNAQLIAELTQLNAWLNAKRRLGRLEREMTLLNLTVGTT